MCYNTSCSAGVAHPVERHLAKVEVASSSLVTRSINNTGHHLVPCIFYYAVTTAQKKVPTVRWTVGGEGLTEPNINFCEAKMQASLVTSSVQAPYPVAVPEKIIGLTLFLDFFDRCHSFTSLHLPLAALGSLPLAPAQSARSRSFRCTSSSK